MPKAGKRGNCFAGTCERCLCHSERLLTILYYERTTIDAFRELRCHCPGCRKATSRHWRWPEPTSQDDKIEKAIKAQEAFDR